MVVLNSDMDRQKSPKNSPKTEKTTLLLAQDLSYARNLAANEEKVRRRSLKYLKKYLEHRYKATSLSEESLSILWKGLFYSMWMSDKALVQEECAENISNLIHCLQFEEAMAFFKVGLVTLQNEWFGIDQLRLNKFLMFVRRLLRQALFVLKTHNFKKHPNEVFTKVLEDTILSTSQDVPVGLFMHFTEIYLEELAKVAYGTLQSSRTLDFLKPYISKLAFAKDNRIVKWIIKFVFTHLMKQHKLGLEYEDKYNIWKQQGFVGSINQIQKVLVAEEDSEVWEETSTEKKPLDPRAGKIDVELPQIHFNAREISEALLIPRNDSRTSKHTRNHLTIWSEKFLKLHNGIYPLGIKTLEPKKRKNTDIDTNITRAAKRLIKFEQKLLAKDNKVQKRKREDEEPDVVVEPKKKKKKPTVTENSGKEQSYEKKLTKKKKPKSPPVELNTIKATKAKQKNKPAENEPENLDDSYIDEYHFCFKRNSGIWYVTPETPEPKVTGQPKEERTEEYEIFVPSKKFVNKLKMTKSTEEVEQVLSKLRGKSRTSLNNLPDKKKVFKTGSPKKVVINTKLNVSQEIDDHILQVQASPQLPWDSSKKPGKPLLKSPVKASPINPFYKLKKF